MPSSDQNCRSTSSVEARSSWSIAEQLPFVETVQHYSVTDSTMARARDLRECPAKGLHVIVADRQTAGRGQRGNTFYSDVDGGLWCTVVAAIPSLESHFRYNRAISLAILGAIADETGSLDVRIKWPNDLYWADRKVCGILLETLAFSRPCLSIGFGVNVNLEEKDFPPDLLPMATSLLIQTNRTYSPSSLLCRVLTEFDQWVRHPDDHAHAVYSQHLYRPGRRVRIQDTEGTFDGVLSDGRACIRTDAGAAVYFSGGPMLFI
jgi:BirA family transcriptional regulator, biotin operon repressor / biotin---[acetyl-CoA-carboxylase] ligase